MSASAGPPPFDSAAQPAGQSAAAGKPRFALSIATAFGLGYLPKAPGTWGSLGGLVLVALPFLITAVVTWTPGKFFVAGNGGIGPILAVQLIVTVAAAAIGWWSASRAALFWKQKDPQQVVIDEVSGQHLAIVLGVCLPVWRGSSQPTWGFGTFGQLTMRSVLSWKYLLVGLILFRVFDIWKPFPVRQAESLPGGWGIMADDWVAAVYAGIGVWIARAAGL